MKKVEGWICVVTIEYPPGHEYNILFGKNIGDGMGMHQNFETNGFVSYDSIKKARQAKKEIEKRNDLNEMKTVRIARIKMVIAETREEFFSFKNKQNLVVLKKEEYVVKLVGKYVEGKPHIYPLKGAMLTRNGFAMIDIFDYALHVATEINRQAQCAASIATFEMEWI